MGGSYSGLLRQAIRKGCYKANVVSTSYLHQLNYADQSYVAALCSAANPTSVSESMPCSLVEADVRQDCWLRLEI